MLLFLLFTMLYREMKSEEDLDMFAGEVEFDV